MGEEKKKPETEENKTEEKKTEEEKKPEKDQEKPKSDDGKTNQKEKASKDDNAPPPPPPEIVLRVYMHCEGCARKIRRCLKDFDGVEEILTDCKSQKVVVKGEKADPMKILDRVQKKTHRQVELLSPLPKSAVEGDEVKKKEKKNVEETKKKEDPKPDESEQKKQEPKVITVVIKVHMHCEACSLEIKRRIEKMKEVEVAIPDLKSSTVSVKGTFDPPKLVEYVYKRTGKHAVIVKIDPPPPPPPSENKEESDKGKSGKEENKGGDDGNKNEKKEEGGSSVEEAKPAESGEGGAAAPPPPPPEEEAAEKVAEMKRNEYEFAAPRYGVEMYAYAYPPQIFSDENPNACSIM